MILSHKSDNLCSSVHAFPYLIKRSPNRWFWPWKLLQPQQLIQNPPRLPKLGTIASLNRHNAAERGCLSCLRMSEQRPSGHQQKRKWQCSEQLQRQDCGAAINIKGLHVSACFRVARANKTSVIAGAQPILKATNDVRGPEERMEKGCWVIIHAWRLAH